ncbi:Dyp-type peroxidase family [Nocardioides ginsengisegetis]|uniref:Dyp-type peroxidase family n=1 Tax=Nocardioides ginsengisegetis TaxID=661491 RepID=A0A7W3PA34_9ACTN|nr:Dyp-type peroxidase [Nocardioides ginsengisegetis]MBA8804163.1 Dyp-type peroxidase family [Nocardioides ginsengisegetis]
MTDASFSPSEELRDIQGGAIGFLKDHERLLFINFTDAASAKAFLAEIEPTLANGLEVRSFNEAFSENRRHNGDPDALQSTWVNIWLTRSGLTCVGAPGLETFPEEFASSMCGRAALIGDVGASDPSTWQAPFTGGAEPHAAIVLAGDNLADLDARRAKVEDVCARHSVTIVGRQDGDARPSPFRGHEHFGFKDGVSQPDIEKFTKRGKGGTIPPGDVFIGYPDSEGNISGQPVTIPPPAPSAYNPTPVPPPAQPLPDWTRNGSFVVYRKLRQDVAGFNTSMANAAPGIGLTPEQLAAKSVGRWPSGAPMERVPGCPAHIDPALTDPSAETPALLSAEKINAFDFTDDPDGNNVPRGSHIRKTNPRKDVLADGDTSDKHRMVRRGITYGPEFAPGELAYGQTVPDSQDRGLLFINYQSSIARTFEFVQSHWANREDFQMPGDGKDPIISQDNADGIFNVPAHGQVTFARWVTTVGGGYFFSPSLSGLRTLAR